MLKDCARTGDLFLLHIYVEGVETGYSSVLAGIAVGKLNIFNETLIRKQWNQSSFLIEATQCILKPAQSDPARSGRC